MSNPHEYVLGRYRNGAGLLVAYCLVVLMVGCARNEPPSVSAGVVQAADAGERVTLSGEASDPDGSVVTYHWEQVAGQSVSITNRENRIAQIVTPLVEAPTVLTFRLTAKDDGGATATAEIEVNVEPYGSLSVAVSGTVRSHDTHAPIGGASVTVNQYSDGTPHLVGEAVTDADGAYSVEVPASPGRLTVSVDADGFAAQSEVVALLDTTASRIVHLNMVPVQASQSFGAAEGVAVSVDDQPVVSLPANAVVTATGEAYTGQAVASVAVLDPSKDPGVMPGDFLEWDSDANASTPIESYGAIDVGLETADGAPLQLGGSSAAQVSIPLASGQHPADAPPQMPLYFWSTELGYWVEEGRARLVETSGGHWAYVGAVTHFTTWNADVAYQSVQVSGCVVDGNGEAVSYAEIAARGIDYTGTSSATADGNGRFKIRVRPDSEVELVAASRDESSEAMTIATGEEDTSLAECLALQGERGLADFPIQIEGESGEVEVCVRDHECEDGDAVSVAVDGDNVFSGEIVNEPVCSTLEVEAGKDYVIELTALNGTGFKGACNFADANTGEIRVSGLNTEMQVWRHREGAGSKARIVVATGVLQPFTIVPTPPDATVRLVGVAGMEYEAGVELVAGEYRVEVGAPGYKTREVAVTHVSERPTRFEVELERLYKSGEVFTDALAAGGEGPEMVVIPAGNFRMGCVSRQDCDYHEGPVHDVWIPQPFALSKYEVTFGQWDACVSAGGCNGYRPDDAGWGRGTRPATNVSWADARAYVSWLSRQTGEEYRLPSESEWEYAARAGSSTKFSWGNEIGTNRANCLHFGCGDRFEKTAPVGSFAPNAFGLYDMHGNLREWVEDCWNDSYVGAPSDGSARTRGECNKRVVRDGSWDDDSWDIRAALRNVLSLDGRYFFYGFRVARTLTP